MASLMCFLQVYWLLSVTASPESAASLACDGADAACAVDQADSEVNALRVELLQTQLSRGKAQSGPQAEGAHDERQADVASLSLPDFLEKHMHFDNHSAMDAFAKEHAPAWQKLQANATALSLLSTKIGTQRSQCPLRYTNQWFSPRINLCGSSFTGLASCSEAGCSVLSGFLYASHCHFVYYTNAESKSDGFGMCRCYPSSVYSVTRYVSNSGNNIYSCSSIM